MNILEFLQFIGKEHYSKLAKNSEWQDLFAIRLLLQSNFQSTPFFAELDKINFFEFKESDQAMPDLNQRRAYIIKLLKQHAPQAVVGEILTDIVNEFPKDILPPTTLGLDKIDLFTEIVSENSEKKSISENLKIIEDCQKGKLDEFIGLITTLRKGVLMHLKENKKPDDTLEEQYGTICKQYEGLTKHDTKIIPDLKVDLKAKKIANNIIRQNIKEFIGILKQYDPTNVEWDKIQMQLSELEKKVSAQEVTEPAENELYDEAKTILDTLNKFLKTSPPSETVSFLQKAVKLTAIQADISILQKHNKLALNEDTFDQIPKLIKTIKTNFTTKPGIEKFKRNIKFYLHSCKITEDNIPRPFSTSHTKIKQLGNIYASYKKSILDKPAGSELTTVKEKQVFIASPEFSTWRRIVRSLDQNRNQIIGGILIGAAIGVGSVLTLDAVGIAAGAIGIGVAVGGGALGGFAATASGFYARHKKAIWGGIFVAALVIGGIFTLGAFPAVVGSAAVIFGLGGGLFGLGATTTASVGAGVAMAVGVGAGVGLAGGEIVEYVSNQKSQPSLARIDVEEVVQNVKITKNNDNRDTDSPYQSTTTRYLDPCSPLSQNSQGWPRKDPEENKQENKDEPTINTEEHKGEEDANKTNESGQEGMTPPSSSLSLKPSNRSTP